MLEQASRAVIDTFEIQHHIILVAHRKESQHDGNTAGQQKAKQSNPLCPCHLESLFLPETAKRLLINLLNGLLRSLSDYARVSASGVSRGSQGPAVASPTEARLT